MGGDVAGARWLRAESLHVTLAFLGSVEEAEPVIEALGSVYSAPARVSLDVRRAFPSANRARVLVHAGGADPALEALHARVCRALAGHYEPDDRPFRPHVTLARLKSADAAEVRRWLHAPAVPVAFEARELVLFESRPGSDYRPLVEYPLADG
jgi:2'-5' RNA ligase